MTFTILMQDGRGTLCPFHADTVEEAKAYARALAKDAPGWRIDLYPSDLGEPIASYQRDAARGVVEVDR